MIRFCLTNRIRSLFPSNNNYQILNLELTILSVQKWVHILIIFCCHILNSPTEITNYVSGDSQVYICIGPPMHKHHKTYHREVKPLTGGLKAATIEFSFM